MAIFAKVIPSILAIEGEYTPGEFDYGGETKYGISKRQYPHLDIANLDETRALTILESDYWNRYRIGEIIDQTIANQVFFLFINMSPIDAAIIVQKAVNACGRTIISVKTDGVMGSITIQAINSISRFWLGDRIKLEACRYYLDETDKDKNQIPNFRGWIRRALA